MASFGFNDFSTIAALLKPACQLIITEKVIDIADLVQANAPVLSGFMHDSVYYVTPDGASSYGQASPPTDDVYLLPEELPSNDMQGLVGVGANYSEWVEQGDHTSSGSYVPAHPFFYPAFEQGAAIFEGHMSELESLL